MNYRPIDRENDVRKDGDECRQKISDGVWGPIICEFGTKYWLSEYDYQRPVHTTDAETARASWAKYLEASR